MQLIHPVFYTCLLLTWASFPSANSWSINKIIFNWLSTDFYSEKQNESYSICNTYSCRRTGKILLQGLNPGADPCNDFYEFSCGNWAISNPIPPNSLDWSCLKRSESIVKKRSLEILESKVPPDAIRPSKLLRQVFLHCMDTAGRERAGITPITIVTRMMGGWPLIGNSNDTIERKWQYVDQYYMNLMKTNSLFKITVSPDYLHRANNQIMITPGKFSRSELFPLAERWKGWPENDTTYTLLVKEVAKIFLNEQKISFTNEDLHKDISDMLQFEHELYKIEKKNSKNSSRDMATIDELQRHYDEAIMNESNDSIHNPTAEVDWLEVIRVLLAPWNFTIDDSEKLFVPSWNFFAPFGKLLNKTKNKVIVNYIHWKFVMLMMPFVNDQMKVLIHNEAGKSFIQTDATRREDCLTEIRLTHALYREYAQEYFPRSEKIEITNMAEIVRDEAIEMIKNSHWLDNKTQTEIIEKIRAIHIMIGYPDWYDDNGTAITDYYKEFVLGDSHFEDTLNNLKFAHEKILAEFRQPMKKYKWFLEPLALNGLYKYYFNALLVTMAFAQSPIYATNLPIAVKYGLLGSVIGHEIFHSLDPRGVAYDKNWERITSPLNTINKYRSKIECIVDQFDNSTLIEVDPTTLETINVQVRGSVSKNEDMADMDGIRAAFDAYRLHAKNNEPSRLIGLEEFNGDQLFFISYANKWCQTAKIKWWEENYGSDEYDAHSPSRLRVNRPMSNFNEFAKAFNCPTGTKMNPQSKCIVFGD